MHLKRRYMMQINGIGYGSIAINTIFRGTNIHKSQLWLDVNKKGVLLVLTHPPMKTLYKTHLFLDMIWYRHHVWWLESNSCGESHVESKHVIFIVRYQRIHNFHRLASVYHWAAGSSTPLSSKRTLCPRLERSGADLTQSCDFWAQTSEDFDQKGRYFGVPTSKWFISQVSSLELNHEFLLNTTSSVSHGTQQRQALVTGHFRVSGHAQPAWWRSPWTIVEGMACWTLLAMAGITRVTFTSASILLVSFFLQSRQLLCGSSYGS